MLARTLVMCSLAGLALHGCASSGAPEGGAGSGGAVGGGGSGGSGEGGGAGSAGSGGTATGGSGGAGAVLAALEIDEDSPQASLRADLPGGGDADLFFPVYSVREPARVTISELPAVSLPTGTVVGGVRLGPDGLKLYGSASLSLTVPGVLDQATTLAFSIRGGVVSYQPVRVQASGDSTRVDIPLDGFSDHGLVSNADPEVIEAAVTASTPPLERLYAQLSVLTESSAVEIALGDFFRNEVKPRLETAALLPEAAVNLEVAMRMYLSWRDQLQIMSAIHPDLGDAGVDPLLVEVLLKDAILANVQHWNERCFATFDPADARRVVGSWLWSPAVFLDRVPGLRRSDLLDVLCVRLKILGAELDAVLDGNLARPLVIRTGLQVLQRPERFDTPVRIRVAQVLGGTVSTDPAFTDAAGVATMSATVDPANPAIAAVLRANPRGFADLLEQEIRIFRPRRGAERELIGGRRFDGTVTEYFLYAPSGGAECPPVPSDGPCAGQAECKVGGTDVHRGGSVVIAGDPLGYEVDFTDRLFTPPAGSEDPPPIVWRHRGAGTFSAVNGAPAVSYTQGGNTVTAMDQPVIASHALSLSVSGDTGKLSGRVTWRCHRQELEMDPVP